MNATPTATTSNEHETGRKPMRPTKRVAQRTNAATDVGKGRKLKNKSQSLLRRRKPHSNAGSGARGANFAHRNRRRYPRGCR